MEEQNKTENKENGVVENSYVDNGEGVVGDAGQMTSNESITNNEVTKDKPENGNSDGNDNFVAALSYLGILVLVPLLTKKDDEFVQFHIKQGLVLLVVWVIGWVIFWIPIIGWLVAIALFICTVIAFIQALGGKKWEIPLVADLAKKINL